MNMIPTDLRFHTCIILNRKPLAGRYLSYLDLLINLQSFCKFVFLVIISPLSIYCRAECSCNPVRLFAVLSAQRSGSGWFETLLNSHINITSNGEIFSVKERRENASSILRTLDMVYNLDLFTSASKNHCSAAVGFKWMLNQVKSFC